HKQLPATLHADEPSPHVDWSAGEVRLLSEPRPWQADGRPRRAGGSSFGGSGTHAHIILQEAPQPAGTHTPPGTQTPAGAGAPQAPAVVDAPGTCAWVVSGRTADGLRVQAARLAEHLAARPGLDPADVAWSLARTRSVFEYRAVVTGTGCEELTEGL